MTKEDEGLLVLFRKDLTAGYTNLKRNTNKLKKQGIDLFAFPEEATLLSEKEEPKQNQIRVQLTMDFTRLSTDAYHLTQLLGKTIAIAPWFKENPTVTIWRINAIPFLKISYWRIVQAIYERGIV